MQIVWLVIWEWRDLDQKYQRAVASHQDCINQGNRVLIAFTDYNEKLVSLFIGRRAFELRLVEARCGCLEAH